LVIASLEIVMTVRRIIAGAVVVVFLAASLGVAGYFLFTRPHSDPLVKADAIVVLGGDMDGRIEYGLSLARLGYAHTVVLSDAYKPNNARIARGCRSGTAQITVVCFRPDPFTTRGEAMFTQRLAYERGWKHVIVVSWNYHLVRARYIFGQCFDGTVTMRAVPRTYDLNAVGWAGVYLYQYSGLAKATVLGC
jgi:uncharacterized SAM-binding protein YcdF (DUF218 family)